MQPFNIRPDQLTKEVADYGRKLGKGVENLINAGEIVEGVTPRVEVYREDKLRLYRYEIAAVRRQPFVQRSDLAHQSTILAAHSVEILIPLE